MSGKNVSIPLGQYIWVVKVCHNIWVTNLKGENFQGVQKKLGGIFQGGKKVAAVLTIQVMDENGNHRMFDMLKIT